ncbi:MAG: putative toxin-antitoxin system toxin component, PIN family [Acidimicrobiia bacterium]
MSRRPRLLLDTEALLRAWRNDGPARELLQRGMVRDYSLCTSTTILDEVEEVLARPKFGAPGDERQLFRRTILLAADEIAVFDEADAPRRSRDPGDDQVIEAAVRTRAEIVVSQNESDLASAGYEVLNAAQACERLRLTEPFGTAVRLAPADLTAQAEDLAAAGGDPHNVRTGADVRFRAITNPLEYVEGGPAWRFTALSPHATADLAIDLVRSAGRGLLLDAADGGSFDFISGTWFDAPGRGGAIPFDLIWYSSERAQAQAIEAPDRPTIADYGWLDEHRHRTLLAGGVVVIVDTAGPAGEPDVRYLALIGEPLAPVPEIDNEFRRATSSETRMRVVRCDPAAFVGALYVWLTGGPTGIIFPSGPPPRAVDAAFDLARDACRRIAWPSG